MARQQSEVSKSWYQPRSQTRKCHSNTHEKCLICSKCINFSLVIEFRITNEARRLQSHGITRIDDKSPKWWLAKLLNQRCPVTLAKTCPRATYSSRLTAKPWRKANCETSLLTLSGALPRSRIFVHHIPLEDILLRWSTELQTNIFGPIPS